LMTFWKELNLVLNLVLYLLVKIIKVFSLHSGQESRWRDLGVVGGDGGGQVVPAEVRVNREKVVEGHCHSHCEWVMDLLNSKNVSCAIWSKLIRPNVFTILA
jgi:hypothetical protein